MSTNHSLMNYYYTCDAPSPDERSHGQDHERFARPIRSQYDGAMILLLVGFKGATFDFEEADSKK